MRSLRDKRGCDGRADVGISPYNFCYRYSVGADALIGPLTSTPILEAAGGDQCEHPDIANLCGTSETAVPYDAY